jgi:Na+-driven multidrug efflux pump
VNETITLPVFEIVGSSLCVASDDGQKIYERIEKAIRQGLSVALSFVNITSLTSAFLNAAIGQLYGEFSEEEIRAKLTVRDMEPDDLALLKRVVETAKAYFSNPEFYKKATEELLGG